MNLQPNCQISLKHGPTSSYLVAPAEPNRLLSTGPDRVLPAGPSGLASGAPPSHQPGGGRDCAMAGLGFAEKVLSAPIASSVLASDPVRRTAAAYWLEPYDIKTQPSSTFWCFPRPPYVRLSHVTRWSVVGMNSSTLRRSAAPRKAVRLIARGAQPTVERCYKKVFALQCCAEQMPTVFILLSVRL